MEEEAKDIEATIVRGSKEAECVQLNAAPNLTAAADGVENDACNEQSPILIDFDTSQEMPVKPNKTDSDHESDPRSNLESRLLHQAELIAKMQNLLFHCRQRMINDSMRNNDPAMDSFFASGPVTSTPLKEDGEDETVAAGIDETDRVVLLQRQLEEEYHEKEKVIAMMGRFKRTLEERILSHRLLEDNWKQKEEEYAVHIARDKELVTNLWRAFQQMKREFFNCRSSTFRDLASMGGELRGVIKQVDVSFHKLHISCCRLYSGQLGDQESEEFFGNKSDVGNKSEAWKTAIFVTNAEIESLKTKLGKVIHEKEKLQKMIDDKNLALNKRPENKVEESFMKKCNEMVNKLISCLVDSDVKNELDPRRESSVMRGSQAILCSLDRILQNLQTQKEESKKQRKVCEQYSTAFEEQRKKFSQEIVALKENLAKSESEKNSLVQAKQALEQDLFEERSQKLAALHQQDVYKENCGALEIQLQTKSDELASEVNAGKASQIALEKIASEKEALKNTVLEREQEINKLRSERQRDVLECETLKRTLTAMEREVADARMEQDRVASELKDAHLRYHILKSDFDLLSGNSQTEQLREDLERARVEQDKLQEQLRKTVVQLKSLKEENFSLTKSLECTTVDRPEKLRFLEEKEKELSTLRFQLASKNSLFSDMQSKMDKLASENKKLEEQLSVANNAKLKAEDQCFSMHLKFEAQADALAVANEERNSLLTANKQLSETITAWKAEVEQLQLEKTSLETAKQNLLSQLSSDDQQLRVLLDENEDLMRQLADLKESEKEHAQQITNLQTLLTEQIENQKGSVENILNELASTRAQLFSVQIENEEMWLKSDRYYTKLEEITRECSQKKDHVNALNLKNQSLLIQLNEQTDALAQTELEMKQLQLECKNVREQRDQCQADLQSSLNTIEALKAEIDSLKSAEVGDVLLTKNDAATISAVEDLRQKLASAEERNSQLTMLNNELETRLLKLREEFASLKDNIRAKDVMLSEAEKKVTDEKFRCDVIQNELDALKNVVAVREESERQLKAQMESLNEARQKMQETIATLRESFVHLEADKRHFEVQAKNSAREIELLKKTCVENERIKEQQFAVIQSMNEERAKTDKAISSVESRNAEMNQCIQELQGQIALMDQEHAQKLSEVSAIRRRETDALEERCKRLKKELLQYHRRIAFLEGEIKKHLRKEKAITARAIDASRMGPELQSVVLPPDESYQYLADGRWSMRTSVNNTPIKSNAAVSPRFPLADGDQN